MGDTQEEKPADQKIELWAARHTASTQVRREKPGSARRVGEGWVL